MAGISTQSCIAEFTGTFLLILTVGCNVLSGNGVWGGVSIACVLMVSIYALGAASGANFNPAVSFSLGLAGKMEESWKQVGVYSAVQILAGLCASACYFALFGKSFNLSPNPGFSWWEAAICEAAYTFMLCFVVLNTAASKKLGGKNQFYGLAIGFVIVAGAYGAGAVSGGCFNPAVAFAICASSAFKGFGWCILYIVSELIGAAAAVKTFHAIRPEEKDDASVAEPSLHSKLIAEFVGTFFLVLTVGLNVLGGSKAGAYSIAASLMCMIYALGDVSGAHFNPAVTLAIFVRGKIDAKEAGKYVQAQLAGAIVAGYMYAIVHSGFTFPLGPGKSYRWADAALVEFVFTFVLCLVVLCVATVDKAPTPQLFGLAIGSCIVAGGYGAGGISGGSLNPAVSVGIEAAHILGGGYFVPAIGYAIVEALGGAAAAGIFKMVYPEECTSSKDIEEF